MCARFADHTFRIRLELTYEQALEQVMATLMSDGFGNLRELGVKSDPTAKPYIGRPMCSPRRGRDPGRELTCQARDANPGMDHRLPYDVILFEEDGDSVVSMLQPAIEPD